MEKKTWREQYMMDRIDFLLDFTEKQMDETRKVLKEDLGDEKQWMRYVDWCGRYSSLAVLKEDFERLWKES